MSDPIRPSDIAAALNISRPDLEVAYGSTGGNVMGIVATVFEKAEAADEQQITIGTAGDHLGWSDWTGERFGGWPGLVDDTEEDHAWYNDEPLEDGAVIIARISVMLLEELPPSEPITKGWDNK